MQKSGNSVDFLMGFYGMDFMTAVSELVQKEFTGQEKKEFMLPDIQSFSFGDISLSKDMRRGVAYLNKTRCIDYKVIQKLIKEKYIFQESKTNNLIFPMYDEHKKIVGG